MVQTKSIHDPAEDSDGCRLLVSRYWPRPHTRESLKITDWLRTLAPSVELLRQYKSGELDAVAYLCSYVHEMCPQAETLARLAIRSRTETITLLCFEPEGEICHRTVLAEMISKAASWLPNKEDADGQEEAANTE